ncbi:hypothetical protein KP509_11G015400 [Ceratopteris richardii]|uniref:SMP domain-containing protein n=1 Tax=Ceratopteris richardii TaxID=49495 RepID=A0A8T2TQ82_CERRI|nr:hypothetical protein KP509_11G015400 [Ceratopteris richardii]
MVPSAHRLNRAETCISLSYGTSALELLGVPTMSQMEQQQQMQVPALSDGPVTYGHLFNVEGELAKQPITPKDASLMQCAETMMRGGTSKDSAAAAMQRAADQNVRMGALPTAHDRSLIGSEGVTAIESILPSEVVHTEVVDGQPILSVSIAVPMTPSVAAAQEMITIGKALEAAAKLVGEKAIEPSDASAIQSAEKRATGVALIAPGGMAATAQAAAELNPRVEDYSKTTIADVLTAMAGTASVNCFGFRMQARSYLSTRL